MKSKRSVVGVVAVVTVSLGIAYCWQDWQFRGRLVYSDEFKDPMGVFNLFEDDVEVPGGRPYQYGHTWTSMFLDGQGIIWARMIE